MSDIRLYYYEAGTLIKPSFKKHKHTSVESAKEAIEWLREKRRYPYQFVITEYEGTYKSKIIEIV